MKMDPRRIQFPLGVGIETLALCNARCTFCIYPTMERVGDRMDDALFDKIIDDLTGIPQDLPFDINLSRVNEPMLDRRLYGFIARIKSKLPKASVNFPTNGSVLTERTVAKLSELGNLSHITVSLHETEPEVYERVLGIPFARTLAGLEILHRAKADGRVPFRVVLKKVGGDAAAKTAFALWCQTRFPLFQITFNDTTNWLGLIEADPDAPLNTSPCAQWFNLMILADGRHALCCFDGTGRGGVGNVRDTHALVLYNNPQLVALRRRFFGHGGQGVPKPQDPAAPSLCHDCR
ncbi:SPASM domain-containing protein [Magnetospira thiophila]